MSKSEKFMAGCDKVMAFAFYALIYFLPISIALAEIFTNLALICFLLKRSTFFWINLKLQSAGGKVLFVEKIKCFCRSFKPVENCLNKPIIFLLIFSLISVMFSQYRSLSFNGFLGKVLQSAFLYFNFIECINTRKRLKIFLGVFLVSYLLICINGLYQIFVGHGFIFGHIFNGRISSSLRHANDFGAYLILIIPALFYLTFLVGPPKQNEGVRSDESVLMFPPQIRMLFGIVFLIGLICLGLTYSRGAWVGFIFSLLLMSFLAMRNFRFIGSSILLIIVFLLVFYPGMVVQRAVFRVAQPTLTVKAVGHTYHYEDPNKEPVSQNAQPVPRKIIDGIEHHYGTKEFGFWEKLGLKYAFIAETMSSLEGNNRLGYWKRSLSIIKDYPFFGSGLNTYALIEGRYSNGWGGYPHNSYLQMTAETGFFGITVFLWILLVLFRDSFRALKKIDNQKHKILFFGLLTGLLGFLIHSFFDTNFYSVQLGSLMWIIFGVIMVAQKTDIT